MFVGFVLFGLFILMVFALIGGAVWVTRREKARAQTKPKTEDMFTTLLGWSRGFVAWGLIGLMLTLISLRNVSLNNSQALSYAAIQISSSILLVLVGVLLWKRNPLAAFLFLIDYLATLVYAFYINNFIFAFIWFAVGLGVIARFVWFWKRGIFKGAMPLAPKPEAEVLTSEID